MGWGVSNLGQNFVYARICSVHVVLKVDYGSGVFLSAQFYALYKQARDGPNKTTKPGFWDPTARAKW